MAINAFRKIDSEDRIVNTIQENVDAVFKQVLQKPIVNSILLQNVTLVAGKPNIINTLLGAKLQGWTVVRIRSNSIVWDAQDTNTDPTKTLVLLCSANVVVDLLVF